MSAKTEGIIRSLRESLKRENEKKTSGYDTRATIRRIEDGVAWVHIPGGVDETPVTLTIGANVGDEVQVRVSGGRAFLVGNATAPPTDDKYARKVNYNLGQQIEQTNVVMRTINRAVQAVKKIADNTNQYFWHTEEGTDTGAHITEIPQEEFLADPEHGGGNLLARSNGVAVRDGLRELSRFSADGLEVLSYDTDGTEIEVAHLGYGEGASTSGTAVAPYYTIGTRANHSTIGNYSCAEGSETTASGYASHAEGVYTVASGSYAHAEGAVTVASADQSHAEGEKTEASGYCSHAQNEGTIAGHYCQTAIGQWNDNNINNAFEIGNGNFVTRSNAFSVDWKGNILSGNTNIVPCMMVQTWSQTLPAGTQSTITGLTASSLPTGATVLGCTVIGTPNNHWVMAYAYASGSTFNINYWNHATVSVSGSFVVLIFYTL